LDARAHNPWPLPDAYDAIAVALDDEAEAILFDFVKSNPDARGPLSRVLGCKVRI
jgi:hypothetical protein